MPENSGPFKPALAVSHLFQRPTPAAGALAAGAAALELKSLPQPGWLNPSPGQDLIFHWHLGPVLADFETQFHREGLGPFLAENNVKLFSCDLGPAASRHLSILPLSPPESAEAILNKGQAALRLIRRYYQGPVAFENYNFYPTGLYNHVTEPDFVLKFLSELDAFLVLDLAHGAITAHNQKQAPLEYFQNLPLDRLTEIHISRPYLPKNGWGVDLHGLPGNREFDWLSAVLGDPRMTNTRPYVVIEYYKNLKSLAAVQGRLKRAAMGPGLQNAINPVA